MRNASSQIAIVAMLMLALDDFVLQICVQSSKTFFISIFVVAPKFGETIGAVFDEFKQEAIVSEFVVMMRSSLHNSVVQWINKTTPILSEMNSC